MQAGSSARQLISSRGKDAVADDGPEPERRLIPAHTRSRDSQRPLCHKYCSAERTWPVGAQPTAQQIYGPRSSCSSSPRI